MGPDDGPSRQNLIKEVADLKMETVQDAVHYVAEEKPEAVAYLIERYAAE